MTRVAACSQAGVDYPQRLAVPRVPRRRRRRGPQLPRLLATLLAALTLASSAPAAEEEAEARQKSEPHVVIVGVGDYADKQIKDRPRAEDDAKALYDLFTDKDYLGAKPKNVRLLLGKPDGKRDSEAASRANILKALEWLAAEAKPDDLTIFAFIGEGGPLGNKSERRCYFASDSSFKDRGKTAIAAAEIAERLAKLKSRHFVGLIDVNFKGFTLNPGQKVQDPTLNASPYREFLGDAGGADHNFLPGRTIFLATNGLSASLDLKEHGLFTHVLLAGLKGAADKEGYEPDGHVTVGELFTYVNKELPRLARAKGKTDDEKAQTHFVLGERESTTPVTTNPEAIGKARERLEKLEKLLADKKIAKELGEEGEKLLSQMPKLKTQREMRKAYQKLVDGELTVAKFEKARAEILEGRKLDRAVAEKFADKVWDATGLLAEEYVKKVDRGELVSWALRGLYRRLGEKVPPELAGRLAKSKGMEEEKLKELLIDARMHLGKREDLAGSEDVDIALQRMLSNLDPYTTYIDPETLERFKRGTEGAYTGIGVQIRKDRASDMLLVVTPLKGSPAYAAGVRAGDLISSITLTVDKEGKPLDKPEVIQTRGLSINEAVSRIVGQEGTPVKLTVKREGEKKPLEFEVKRGRIEMETVMGFRRKPNDDWDYMLDPESKIGYFRLTQFTRNSARDVLKAVQELKDAGVKGLVFDLRFNPGGLLHSAREISDLFIDDGLIVSIRPRGGREDKLVGESEGSYLDFPMVVLVNGGSASGSEIVAAALQDHGRAVVMGERSFGKGSVQNVVPFGGGEMKLTTASFWRPSGKNLNKSSTKGRDEDEWGVLPNKGFERNLNRKETDDLEEHQAESEIIYPKGVAPKWTNPDFKDRQLDMALKYLKEQINLAARVNAKAVGSGQ